MLGSSSYTKSSRFAYLHLEKQTVRSFVEYTVKQFAAMFGITEHTVRYYTDIGILPCVRRGAGGRRVFNEESVNWMQGIACLKGCGASIEAIREYCELCKLPESRKTLAARYKIICDQRDQAHLRLAEAQKVADFMDAKTAHYEQVLAGELNDDTNPANWTPDTRPSQHVQ